MQEYRILIETSNIKLPGLVKLTMDYESASRLYEYVKREMGSRRDYYKFAKMGEGKGTPDAVIRSLERDLEAFSVIYKGFTEAYRWREEV